MNRLFKLFTFALVTCGILMSAAPISDKKADNPATVQAELQAVRDQLQAKAQTGELSKAEIKALKKAEKQLDKMEKNAADGKKWLVAVLLCFFLGGLGIHRFYLGYTWQGVVQLLTLGGLGIWVLIDFIRILIRDLKPKGGDYVD
jgi:outer membrane murein-binding lipoprotein Lpp